MKDWDIEVYGLSADVLKKRLKTLGSVHEVGKSFKVYKWAVHKEVFDVSIPQSSNAQGVDQPILGTSMDSIKKASIRRDLTINAISYDPILDEYLDPYNGMNDLSVGRLNPVNKETFLQDPLRVFRAAQFASRFHFQPTDLLIECFQTAVLGALPMERVQGEFFKLFCVGDTPSLGLNLLCKCPDYVALYGAVSQTSQRQQQALDTLAQSPLRPFSNRARHWCAALCIWTNGFTAEDTEQVLNQLGIFSMDGFNVRHHVLASKTLDRPLSNTAATVRHLSTQMDLEVLTALCHALEPNNPVYEATRHLCNQLGILHNAPEPVLKGRHLQPLGIPPGPHMGAILSQTYTAQLDGTIVTLDEASAFATSLLKK